MGWVGQGVMAQRPKKQRFSALAMCSSCSKKKLWSPSKGRDAVTHPSAAPGLASKPAGVSGKAPSDLNAWDLKKSLLRAGHQVTGFAGRTPILLGNSQFYSSTCMEHRHPKNGSGKISAPPGSSIHPFPQLILLPRSSLSGETLQGLSSGSSAGVGTAPAMPS